MISPTPTGGGSFLMNLFGLRPSVFLCNPIARCIFLICAIYFAFLSVSFIGLHLGASCLVHPAADMRSAVGSKVDFQPRFDKFFEFTRQSWRKGFCNVGSRLFAAGCSVHRSAVQSVADLVGYALFRVFRFVSWEFVLPAAPTSTFLNSTTTLVTCA